MNTQYFCSNEKFTDSDLINIEKSLETLYAINSISLNFVNDLKFRMVFFNLK